MYSRSRATVAGLPPTPHMALSPVPMPMAIRPGAISSRVRSAEAVTAGSRDSGLVTAVMTRDRFVCWAHSAAVT